VKERLLGRGTPLCLDGLFFAFWEAESWAFFPEMQRFARQQVPEGEPEKIASDS
jgi:hypothetical protein